MIKPLNSLLPYSPSEKTKPGGQTALAWVQTRPPCRNLAWAGKERTFSGPLVHAQPCPRGQEAWGVTNIEGCRACGALITPQPAPRSGTGLPWAPSHPTERNHSGDLGLLVNTTIKEGKSTIFSGFCSYQLQAKHHCCLLVLNCHWDFNGNRENRLYFQLFFWKNRISSDLIYTLLHQEHPHRYPQSYPWISQLRNTIPGNTLSLSFHCI